MEGQGDSCRQEAGEAGGKPFADLTIDSPLFSVFPITRKSRSLLQSSFSSIRLQLYTSCPLGLTLSHFVYISLARVSALLSAADSSLIRKSRDVLFYWRSSVPSNGKA
jgi:hypothetical protein